MLCSNLSNVDRYQTSNQGLVLSIFLTVKHAPGHQERLSTTQFFHGVLTMKGA